MREREGGENTHFAGWPIPSKFQIAFTSQNSNQGLLPRKRFLPVLGLPTSRPRRRSHNFRQKNPSISTRKREEKKNNTPIHKSSPCTPSDTTVLLVIRTLKRTWPGHSWALCDKEGKNRVSTAMGRRPKHTRFLLFPNNT